MSVELREVKTKQDLDAFIRFPLALYKGNPYYVPNLYDDEVGNLSPEKNPAFEEAKARYWLAYREGKVVGRVAAILMAKEEVKWGARLMRFGWIDFIDDAEVVKALLGQVENWAKEEGVKGVHGPLGFTDLDREGLMVDGFDQVATLASNYSFPYYQKQIEALGYTKDVDWVGYEITLTDESADKIARAAQIVSKRYNLHLFKGKKGDLLKIAPEIFEVLEEAYRNLYGTVPMSRKQVDHYVSSYFSMANLDYIPVVMDENNKIVGFGITFPSLSKALQQNRGFLLPFGFIPLLWALKKNDRADLYLVGIRDEYLGKGVNGMMMNQIYNTFKKNGIKYVDTNLNLETNNDIQVMWKYFDNRIIKRFRCYIKHLS
jgi:GNAT superfamily N-acetyltransferase